MDQKSIARVTMSHVPSDLGWLPEDGVVLTAADLRRILIDLRALVSGTDPMEPNRAYAVDIANTIAQAIERDEEGS
jgi:hypothetical protein